MRKTLIAILLGGVTLATVSGLSVASAVTNDLTLTVDGNSRAIRAAAGDSVADVLAANQVAVAQSDYVSPAPATILGEGESIVVAHAVTLTATIDGKTKTLVTTASTLGSALIMAGIDPDGAKLSLPPQTPVTPGMATVTVQTMKMVTVKADGKTLYTRTTAGTVADVLAGSNVKLSDLDRVTPDPVTVVADGLAITVQRVVVTQETGTGDVPYATKNVDTPSLPKGTTKVTTKGVAGKADVVWNVVMVDGVEESRTVASQTVTTPPVDEVVQVGTGIPVIPPAPAGASGSPQDIAQQMLSGMGFGADQFSCLVQLWDHESHWNIYSMNKKTGAYGIPQALPGSKMASAGDDWQTNPATQIRWGLGYITGRYGTPCGAWSFFQAHHWY